MIIIIDGEAMYPSTTFLLPSDNVTLLTEKVGAGTSRVIIAFWVRKKSEFHRTLVTFNAPFPRSFSLSLSLSVSLFTRMCSI